MSSLAQIQSDMQEYLLGTLPASALLPCIAPGTGLTGTERLSIYHSSYRARLQEALSQAFQKTHSYLGDAMFYAAATAYIEAYPSQQANLRWFGAHFGTFLNLHLPAHPQVAELAQFEWSLGLAFDAADAAPLALTALATVTDWETAGFAITTSLLFLTLHSNCIAIWHALDKDRTPPPPHTLPVASTLMLWRRQLQPHFRTVVSAEAAALQQLREGQSFASICERIVEAYPEAEIASWLQIWLAEELLTAIVS
ncbi:MULTISPECIES: DNA-binding domain-containing protein [unclassified Undibacterium]|uniref:DNA-binding domain-containing protein n=1 Tax=unclassified Undibacterium TaxID=2630295 RepID=UPI002AC9C808|nr:MULTISPECIES: DNA-binding domain-containing protein [unclassified Undibacterium]MEB0138223.1 DNA-binding domain-containing protein [Undibacterium sp. CCC2.1]MEB0171616.1 DNA-binding domain-containing protein [Undibacterium sp. CCC1.1]MEB0175464.1 DNA-binding domain-containing protein [Undibacterium sp. CCC3.4]MEB0214816.1 DNA-binding domain-containing protein [Undibacterium sp. 5I2]WPX45303.1 DNA-binding domain-containing protein [Undibacterium sp. CCC3.4]